MELQFDTRNHRSQEVRIGRDDREVLVFRKANWFIQNLVTTLDGAEHHLKLAAPWNGFQFRLLRGEQELASAKKQSSMHAFEPDRPLIRHPLVEFDLDVGGRALRLTPEDRFALTVRLREGDEERGRIIVRDFKRQLDAPWQGDMELPDDWSLAHAAFLVWLVREGRQKMDTSGSL